MTESREGLSPLISIESEIPKQSVCPQEVVAQDLGRSALVVATEPPKIQKLKEEVASRDEKIKELEEKIKELEIDPVTGLLHRGPWIDKCVAMLSDETRDRDNTTVVAILYMDMDNFKSINDTRGHCTGDQVLAKAANILVETVRVDDKALIGRMGGDEFGALLILGNSPYSEASRTSYIDDSNNKHRRGSAATERIINPIVERFREAFREHMEGEGLTELEVGASFGFCVFRLSEIDDSWSETNIREFLSKSKFKEADRSMYDDKDGKLRRAIERAQGINGTTQDELDAIVMVDAQQ